MTDEQTGHVQKVVIDSKDKNRTPSILIENENEEKKTFHIPTRAYLSVDEGESVDAGTILAKISKQTTKSRDITGGLPELLNCLKQEVRKILQSCLKSKALLSLVHVKKVHAK